MQFILKLNEQTFRPLFLRTYDWAVIDLADEPDATQALTARRTVLYKLIDKLLVQLKVRPPSRFQVSSVLTPSDSKVDRGAILLVHARPDDRAVRVVRARDRKSVV